MLGSFQSDHTAEHNVLGSIPGWGAPCGTVNTGHGHHRATVVAGRRTEPYAIRCCVLTDAGPFPASPGVRVLGGGTSQQQRMLARCLSLPRGLSAPYPTHSS